MVYNLKHGRSCDTNSQAERVEHQKHETLPMNRCKSCQYFENVSTATVCKRCGAPLSALIAERRTNSLVARNSTFPIMLRDKHVGQLGQHDIALYVGDYSEPLIANVTGETILGRTSRLVSLDEHPALDLTRFEAIERGVSRAHAVLQRTNGTLAVTDLGSTNGTWINNVRLTPKVPVRLNNGDRVVLARLALHVYFE